MGKNRRYRPYNRYEGCTVFRHLDGRTGLIAGNDVQSRMVTVQWPDGTRETMPWPSDRPAISISAWQDLASRIKAEPD